MQLIPQSDVLQDEFFQNLYRKDRIHVGLSLVKPEDKKEERRLLETLKQFIRNNYKTADFWYYSLDYHPSYFQDTKLGQKLYEELKKDLEGELKFYFVPNTWHPSKLFSSFKLMDFFVAMRLHAIIFSYRNKLNFVGISYDKKCTSFLESIGREALVAQNLDGKYLQKQFNTMKKKEAI